MRWLKFTTAGKTSWGIVEGERVVAVDGDPFPGAIAPFEAAQRQGDGGIRSVYGDRAAENESRRVSGAPEAPARTVLVLYDYSAGAPVAIDSSTAHTAAVSSLAWPCAIAAL